MEDRDILELYFKRSERAIEETSRKYQGYCYQIAYNILRNREDSFECLNDTWLRAWNAIPPSRPNRFAAYLGKITRNLALNAYQKEHRKKRGSGQAEAVFEELEQAISRKDTPEDQLEQKLLTECINRYLEVLSPEKRMIFVGRYWYFESIEQISEHLKISQSKVKTTLFRIRTGLKEYLEKEGIEI